MSSIGITSPAGQAVNEYINKVTGLRDTRTNTVVSVDQGDELAPSVQSEGNESSAGTGVLKVGGFEYNVSRSISDSKYGSLTPSFSAFRSFSVKFSIKNIFSFFIQRFSALNLDHDEQLNHELKQSGLTPVHSYQPTSSENYVMGATVGASNLDLIKKEDPDFSRTRNAWNKVCAVKVSESEKLSEHSFLVHERCPITGDILTKDNAVLANLPVGNDSYSNTKAVMMSRRGIKNALLRTETAHPLITRETLLNATFESVNNDNFIERGLLPRAVRKFFGGETSSEGYNTVQAYGRN